MLRDIIGMLRSLCFDQNGGCRMSKELEDLGSRMPRGTSKMSPDLRQCGSRMMTQATGPCRYPVAKACLDYDTS